MKGTSILLAALCFTLATQLAVWREQSARQSTQSSSTLQALLGESQKLFASHFVTKADVYLHSGVYPSIFDQARRAKENHLASEAIASADPHTDSPTAAPHHDEAEHHDEGEHRETLADDGEAHEHDAADGFMKEPRDWIDAFGRNFYPSKHSHLDAKGKQREVLPWLRLAADLDPHDVQTYTLGAYWLRNRMGKVDEAEGFLREGWRANPQSYEILFELGRLKEENRNDLARARNLMTAALGKWQASEPAKKFPDEFTLMQILGHLARVEQRDGHVEQAILYLERLLTLSPNPNGVQRQIDELRGQLAATPKASPRG
ncbi:MAG: hypothetical protein U1G07_11835 [Verrucomicrobiota bacterium]